MSRVFNALSRAAERSDEAPEILHAVPAPTPEPSLGAPIQRRQVSAELIPAKKPPLVFPDRAVGEPPAHRVTDPALAEPDGRLVIAPSASPLVVTRYCLLAASLDDIQARSAWGKSAGPERSFKSLLVTSARPGEGKTLTAVNLALTLSELIGKHVLLIDAHLQKPGVHGLLGLRNTAGLSDVLQRNTSDVPLQSVTARLSVLPAGQTAGPRDLASTLEGMEALVAGTASQFDWVLVDGPTTDAPDVAAVASAARAVLLVIQGGVTRLHDIERAIAAVGRSRVVGTVLNRTDGA
jgi:Mrp family chromosome partitioning ATPase